MKKIVLMLFILTLFLMTTLNAFSADGKKFEQNWENLPKEIIIISQSCTMSILYITAIDLSNNEMIIMVYYDGPTNSFLKNIIRTGIIIDPEKQNYIQGNSSPFKPRR